VQMIFHSEYPFKPPYAKFVTKMWHPNIDPDDGAIFVDLLGSNWSPALTIQTTLLCIQSLLVSPDLDDCVNDVAADMCRTSIVDYENRVREYVQEYALDVSQLPASLHNFANRQDAISPVIATPFDLEMETTNLISSDQFINVMLSIGPSSRIGTFNVMEPTASGNSPFETNAQNASSIPSSDLSWGSLIRHKFYKVFQKFMNCVATPTYE
jgi:hypothetical protein